MEHEPLPTRENTDQIKSAYENLQDFSRDVAEIQALQGVKHLETFAGKQIRISGPITLGGLKSLADIRFEIGFTWTASVFTLFMGTRREIHMFVGRETLYKGHTHVGDQPEVSSADSSAGRIRVPKLIISRYGITVIARDPVTYVPKLRHFIDFFRGKHDKIIAEQQQAGAVDCFIRWTDEKEIQEVIAFMNDPINNSFRYSR